VLIKELRYRDDLPVQLIISMASLLVFANMMYTNYFYIETYGQKPNEQIKNLSLHDLIKNGSPFLGNVSAPITIIDFSDFQCYLCNRFVKNTESLINETYIQTGKVALVFGYLPNRGVDSMGAALAAQCTNDQGKFWQFHNLLYSNQKPIDSGWVSKENLKNFALQIPGLDTKHFHCCFDSEKYKSFIQKDIDLALSFGFRETPSFIVENSNGSDREILSGALPFESFKTVIEKKISPG
jgi:protein-disulfide isomerase